MWKIVMSWKSSDAVFLESISELGKTDSVQGVVSSISVTYLTSEYFYEKNPYCGMCPKKDT